MSVNSEMKSRWLNWRGEQLSLFRWMAKVSGFLVRQDGEMQGLQRVTEVPHGLIDRQEFMS